MTALRAVIRADLEQMAEGQPLSRLATRGAACRPCSLACGHTLAHRPVRDSETHDSTIRALAYRPDSGL